MGLGPFLRLRRGDLRSNTPVFALSSTVFRPQIVSFCDPSAWIGWEWQGTSCLAYNTSDMVEDLWDRRERSGRASIRRQGAALIGPGSAVACSDEPEGWVDGFCGTQYLVALR